MRRWKVLVWSLTEAPLFFCDYHMLRPAFHEQMYQMSFLIEATRLDADVHVNIAYTDGAIG